MSDPTKSDLKYFNLMKAWRELGSTDFTFVDSHDKVASVRDSSKRETLRRSLVTRLQNSRNLVLLTSSATKLDTDWVPFELEYAIDTCRLPIIVAYVGHTDTPILDPSKMSLLWPAALHTRINSGAAHAIHVPFNRKPLAAAIEQFKPDVYPRGDGLGWYNRDAYENWGLL